MIELATTIGQMAEAGVLELGDGYRTKRAELGQPGFRIIRVADVGDGTISLDGQDFVSSEMCQKIGSKVAVPGDVILTTKGTVGRVAIMPEHSEPAVYSPQVCYFRVRRHDTLVPRFLAYWLKSGEFAQQASYRQNNTDMAAYISLADLRSVSITLPSQREQRAIAEVLGALDDKIAANTKLAPTIWEHLDAVFAQSLSFGIRTLRVDDVAIFLNRRRVPLSSRQRAGIQGDVPYYGAAGQIDCVDTAIFNDAIVLVGEDGTVVSHDGRAVTQYVWGPSWVNNHAHVLQGSSISTELLRVVVARASVAAAVTGAVQPKLSMTNLKSIAVDLPLDDRLQRLEDLASTEVALYRSVVEESKTLAELRDTLLPPLMSGRLRVKDAEKTVGDVV